MKRPARSATDYTHRIRVWRGTTTHALRRAPGFARQWLTACARAFETRATGPTWLEATDPVTCKRCVKAIASGRGA